MSGSSSGIIITSKANADETAIYNYISDTFGSIYADNFRKRLIEVFRLMARQPFIGRPAKGNASIRVLMMNKQNRIVYKITETEVVVLRILNTGTKMPGEF